MRDVCQLCGLDERTVHHRRVCSARTVDEENARLVELVRAAIGNANAGDIAGFADDADAAGKYHTACILLAVASWMREVGRG